MDKLNYSFTHNSKLGDMDSALPVLKPRPSASNTPIRKLTETFASMKITQQTLSEGTEPSKQEESEDKPIITLDSSDDSSDEIEDQLTSINPTPTPIHSPTPGAAQVLERPCGEGCGCPYCVIQAREGTLRKKLTFSAMYAGPACNSGEIVGCPTPLVNLRVCVRKKGNHNRLVNIRALPDTGASVDCITEKFAKQNGLVVIPDEDDVIELIAAEGNCIQVAGTTELELQLPGGDWVKSTALVCPKLSNQMLLSWITQKKLGMIHKGWSFMAIQHNANSASLSEIPITP